MGSYSTDVVVLVPAAGRGSRLGGKRKQFRQLGSRPVVVQTLRVFERHPEVQHIVVAGPAEGDGELRDILQQASLSKLRTVVRGGATRRESVGAALKAAPEQAGIVLIHDAVRPFVRPRHVSDVIEAVREKGAASLALPVADTVRRGSMGQFGETVPRDQLYRMQTPQGFCRSWIQEAHTAAIRSGRRATDDVELVQRRGYPVEIVEGEARNFKVTTAADWQMARLLWPTWQHEVGD